MRSPFPLGFSLVCPVSRLVVCPARQVWLPKTGIKAPHRRAPCQTSRSWSQSPTSPSRPRHLAAVLCLASRKLEPHTHDSASPRPNRSPQTSLVRFLDSTRNHSFPRCSRLTSNQPVPPLPAACTEDGRQAFVRAHVGELHLPMCV